MGGECLRGTECDGHDDEGARESAGTEGHGCGCSQRSFKAHGQGRRGLAVLGWRVLVLLKSAWATHCGIRGTHDRVILVAVEVSEIPVWLCCGDMAAK